MRAIFRQKTGNEAHVEILKGVQTLTNHVGGTLGPNGRLVAIREVADTPTGHVIILTKDGVTVAKKVRGETAGENVGIDVMREAALLTLKRAGDGTTSTIVVATSIYEQCLSAMGIIGGEVENPITPSELKKQIEDATAAAVARLKEIATPVDFDGDDLLKIATVSTNGDTELAGLIVDAFKAVGYKGDVRADMRASGTESTLEWVRGCRIPGGAIDRSMLNPGTGKVEFHNPIVYIHDGDANYAEGVQKLVDWFRKDYASGKPPRPILYMAGGIGVTTHAALATNNMAFHQTKGEKGAPIVAVKSYPDAAVMEDVARALGTVVYGSKTGKKIDNAALSDMGTCQSVEVDKDSVTFCFNEGDALNDRVEEIRAEIDREEDEIERDKLKERLSRLTVGTSIIKIGSVSATEGGEKFDRVDDAIKAVRCAIEEGWICGGGVGYVQLVEALPVSQGAFILANALVNPYVIIGGPNATTTGMREVLKRKYLEDGIIDPAKVVREVVVNGAKVATYLAITGSFLSYSEPQ